MSFLSSSSARGITWQSRRACEVSAGRANIDALKRPTGGNGRPAHEVAEDVEWLLEQHPLITAPELAERLGYADASGVTNPLRADRANRPDLLERLARNAEIAA